MPILYHFPRSLSSAAAQVVRELDAPVSIRILEFEDGHLVCREEPELTLPTGGMGVIGPVRSCPTFVDDSGTTLIQCAAINERVCDLFDPNDELRPPAGSAERARHLSLMVFAEATLFPVVQFLSAEGSPNDNPREKMRRERFRGLLAPYLLSQLAGRPYLCGDGVTAADFLVGMPCLNNANGAGALDPFPELVAYFERLRSRESFVEAHGPTDDPHYNTSLVEMVATAHSDRWDFSA